MKPNIPGVSAVWNQRRHGDYGYYKTVDTGQGFKASLGLVTDGNLSVQTGKLDLPIFRTHRSHIHYPEAF